jgi:peptidoglycan/xylan/chitin deacetylase (PgdA/CDA1 family)
LIFFAAKREENGNSIFIDEEAATKMARLFEKIIGRLPIDYRIVPPALRNFGIRLFSVKDDEEPVLQKRRIDLCFSRIPVLLTHDVDTLWGYKKGMYAIREAERKFGFNACYNFIAKSTEYKIEKGNLDFLIDEGCEIAAHGLYHDGKFSTVNSSERMKRVKLSKQILESKLKIEIHGYRSPWLSYTSDLFSLLDCAGFDYDMSVPGITTIWPYKVADHKVVEFPLTIPQDYYFLNYKRLKDKEFLDLWINRSCEIAKKGGVAVISAHPDNYDIGGKPLVYEKFLEHILENSNRFKPILPIELFQMIAVHS